MEYVTPLAGSDDKYRASFERNRRRCKKCAWYSFIVEGIQDEIGKYMAQGAGVGFTNELGNVEEDINKSLGTLTKNVAKITPITEVKQSAKVVALNNRVDTTQFTDNSEDRNSRNYEYYRA